MKKIIILAILIVAFILLGKSIVSYIYFHDINIIDMDFIDNSIREKDNKENAFIIDNIGVFNQYPMYPTGCESVALYLLLRHYDIDITVDDVILSLKKGPVPYGTGDILSGANPEREFVGNPYDSSSYGVFEKPIRDVANKFMSGAISRSEITINELEKIIENGSPAITWIRTKENYEAAEYAKAWIDYETGELVSWLRYEHAVLVYGYTNSTIYISNPYNGEKYQIDKEIFKYNFNLMGGRVVYYSK